MDRLTGGGIGRRAQRVPVGITAIEGQPHDPRRLGDALDAGARILGQQPGRRFQRVLRSKDGTQVMNHMHWDGEEAFRRGAARSRVHELIEGDGPLRFDIVS